MEKKDKELYCYKQALSQPYWIQRLTDTISLDSAIRLSFFVYAILVAALAWLLMYLFLHFLPFGLRTVASGALGIFCGRYLSELEIDDRGAVFFLKDYLLFYLRFGMRGKTIYINKGQVYQKPKERNKH